MKHYLNCKECVDLLMDYLEQQLDPETQSQLEEHFSACPPCVNFLENYKNCSAMAQQLKDQEVEVPAEVEDRLKSFLKTEFGG